MRDADRNISLAGVAAAATQSRPQGHGPTLFDDCIITSQQERQKAKDPDERKLLTTCVFAARRFRRNWKHAQVIERHTKQGSNHATHEHQPAGLILPGTSTTAHREKEFEHPL